MRDIVASMTSRGDKAPERRRALSSVAKRRLRSSLLTGWARRLS